MISTALTISIIFNAILITVILFGIWEFKKTRGHLFRKDTFIKSTKNKLQQAQQEINRKESIIMKEKSKGKWATQFFTEEDLDDGFFSKSHIINFKFQLLHNGFPVGPAGLLSTQKYRSVDKEQVNKILEDYAKPLIQAGADVALKLAVTA